MGERVDPGGFTPPAGRGYRPLPYAIIKARKQEAGQAPGFCVECRGDLLFGRWWGGGSGGGSRRFLRRRLLHRSCGSLPGLLVGRLRKRLGLGGWSLDVLHHGSLRSAPLGDSQEDAGQDEDHESGGGELVQEGDAAAGPEDGLGAAAEGAGEIGSLALLEKNHGNQEKTGNDMKSDD